MSEGCLIPVVAEGTSTVAALLASASAVLGKAGFDEPRRHARRLMAAALKLSAAEVFAHPERILDAGEQQRVAAVVARLLAHEPLSRVTGTREFWGLEFLLSPDTLDPRPDTETVVETVLRHLPDRDRAYRFLDLGTGTGCLLLALLSELPNATGIGCDISFGAANMARQNAIRLGLETRAAFVVGDWARAMAGPFDIILANPPYIPSGDIAGLPPEVRDHDPLRALDGGRDGLAAYRTIAGDLPRLLCPGGSFAAEIGWNQADDVGGILAAQGLAVDEIASDLAGMSRCVLARR